MVRSLVSVVTPTLNQGGFIEATIRSIKAQTYDRFEHIVVDGGSTDGTLEILRRHEGTYPMRWLSEPDRGMYDAINKGIALARGEIVAYLNSDDVYVPWAIEAAVETFVTSDADLVYGDGLTIDEMRGRQRLHLTPPFDRHGLAVVGSLFQPAVFVRVDALHRAGGFDPALRFVGDLDLWLRLGRSCRFHHIDEVLAVERLHGGALSSASRDAMAVEETAIRGRHAGSTSTPRPLRELSAAVRAALRRRVLWLRFLQAARRTPKSDRGEWVRFLAQGDVSISPMRAVAFLVPRIGGGFAWNAVCSRRNWLETSV